MCADMRNNKSMTNISKKGTEMNVVNKQVIEQARIWLSQAGFKTIDPHEFLDSSMTDAEIMQFADLAYQGQVKRFLADILALSEEEKTHYFRSLGIR